MSATRKKGDAASAIFLDFREKLHHLVQETDKSSLSSASRRALNVEIRSVVEELGRFLGDLDPIKQPPAVFDPSNPKIIGRFIALAMVAQQRVPLARIEQLYGSGIYAIYYKGVFPLYKEISGSETPIYVGKAEPAINNARTPMEQGAKLSARLLEHGRNIAKASATLSIADFEYRSLVVQSGYEAAAEKYLIHLFRPIWNKETRILYGIGKHGDSATTRANRRSPWDTIHAARKWAAGSAADAKTPERIKKELKEHFAKHRPYRSLDDVLSEFIQELGTV